MYILRLVIFFSLLPILTLANSVNQALVKIDNDYITYYDMLVNKNFIFYDISLTEKQTIEKLILIKAAFKEYKEQDIEVTEDRYIKFQENLIKSFNGLENLQKKLSRFDLTLERLNKYIKEYLTFESIKEKYLLQKIVLKFSQIQDYYNNQYVPEQKKLGLPVKPITEVIPLIKRKIKLQKSDKIEKNWAQEIISHYKVEYLTENY